MRVARHRVRRLIRPPKGNLDSYASEFEDTIAAFLRFLGSCPTPLEQDDRPPVGIVVTPWVSTPGPWLMITLGLGLAMRGRRVTLIWDDLAYPTPGHDIPRQNRGIARVLERVKDRFEIIRLSELTPQPVTPADDADLTHLADLNVIWYSRAQEMSMADSPKGQLIRSSLARTLGAVRTLLAAHPFESLIVTSGKVLNSGPYLLAGHAAGVRVATYDAGVGAIFVSTNGIAAQQHDVARAFLEIEKSPPEQVKAMIAEAQAEFNLRLAGRDKQQFQTTPSNMHAAAAQGEVLLPLSLEWDAGVLGSHTIFENTPDWVCATVEHILASSERTVVVRQHPGERSKFGNSKLDIRAHLAARVGEHPRLRFVGKNDPINTYDLLAGATVVLPHVSTLGIEAAAQGKTVVVASAAYYADLGYVYQARSRAEYFQLLDRGMNGDLPNLPAQEARAWLCYYVAQVCNLVWTDFTGQPPDYWKWVRRSPRQLFADPVFQDVIQAFDQDTPVSLLRHRRKYNSTTNLGAS